jgi:cell pole-organizing protein PopZ
MVYAENEGEVFLGRSVTKTTNMSEETMQKVDAEVRRIIDEQYALARRLIEEQQRQDARHGQSPAGVGNHRPSSSTTSWQGKRAASAEGLDTPHAAGRWGRQRWQPGGQDRPGTDGSLSRPFLPPARAQSRGLAPRSCFFHVLANHPLLH